jgi:hypothetical protein
MTLKGLQIGIVFFDINFYHSSYSSYKKYENIKYILKIYYVINYIIFVAERLRQSCPLVVKIGVENIKHCMTDKVVNYTKYTTIFQNQHKLLSLF